MKEVVETLNPSDSQAIGNLQIIMRNPSIKTAIANALVRYVPLVEFITSVESRSATVRESLAQLWEMKPNLEDPIKTNLEQVLSKNEGLQQLADPNTELYSVEELAALMRAPINSAEVSVLIRKF